MQFCGLLGCIIIHPLFPVLLLSLHREMGQYLLCILCKRDTINALQKCVCNKYFIHICDILVSRDLVLIIATGIHESANVSHCIFTPHIHAPWQQKQ